MSWKLVIQLANNGKTKEYVVCPEGFDPNCTSIKCYWSQVQWPGVTEEILDEREDVENSNQT